MKNNKIIKAIIVWLFILSVMTELCVVSSSVLLYFVWTIINVYLGTLVNAIPFEEIKEYTLYSFMSKELNNKTED